jgi:hypothetical protein
VVIASVDGSEPVTWHRERNKIGYATCYITGDVIARRNHAWKAADQSGRFAGILIHHRVLAK